MFECKECVVKFLWLQCKSVSIRPYPNFLSVTENKLTAVEGVTSNELVASHLNALQSARRRFIETEDDEKLLRALKHKTRTATSLKYQTDRRSSVLQQKGLELLERSWDSY